MIDAIISPQLLGRHKFAFGLITICLISFVTIALISAQIFEHVPHSEDEVAYLFQAKVFAQNRLAAPTPAYPQAFWTPFVVDYQGQRFGKYPPGWPLLLSLGIRLNAPWLVNTLLATFTLALIAWLGECFYSIDSRCLPDSGSLTGKHLGLWAAGLGLVTPGFLFLSSSLLSHTASLFWSTLALAALYPLTTKSDPNSSHLPSPISYPISPALYLPALRTGLALGAAFITRPFAGVGIGLAVGLFVLLLVWRREIGWPVLLWLALGLLSVAALLPLYWWAITGSPTFNTYLLVWPYDRIGFGPDIGPYGYTLSDAIFINTRLKLTALATGLFGWPGWSNLLFLPIPFLARRAKRWDWLLLGTILSLMVVHIFYWAFGGTDGGFPRYYYDALPAFLLLTVRGIQICGEILGEWQKSNFLQWRGRSGLGWLPIGLFIVFTIYNLVWNLPPLLAQQQGKYGITAAQLQPVERANLSEPALIIVKNVERWSDFAAPFAANSPTLDGPIIYASDGGPEVIQKLREEFKERICWELEGEKLRECPE
jgi:4-amino-4-deoxy-L-arabinose transferase-like glycosyltransferase